RVVVSRAPSCHAREPPCLRLARSPADPRQPLSSPTRRSSDLLLFHRKFGRTGRIFFCSQLSREHRFYHHHITADALVGSKENFLDQLRPRMNSCPARIADDVVE